MKVQYFDEVHRFKLDKSSYKDLVHHIKTIKWDKPLPTRDQLIKFYYEELASEIESDNERTNTVLISVDCQEDYDECISHYIINSESGQSMSQSKFTLSTSRPRSSSIEN
jgi:hypothetical protein